MVDLINHASNSIFWKNPIRRVFPNPVTYSLVPSGCLSEEERQDLENRARLVCPCLGISRHQSDCSTRHMTTQIWLILFTRNVTCRATTCTVHLQQHSVVDYSLYTSCIPLGHARCARPPPLRPFLSSCVKGLGTRLQIILSNPRLGVQEWATNPPLAAYLCGSTPSPPPSDFTHV